MFAVQNGLWSALSTLVGSMVSLIASILIVRDLTPHAYGLFSYYLWLAGILFALGTLAFPHSLTKVTSELRGHGQESEAITLSRWIIQGLFGLNLLTATGVLIWALHTVPPQRTYLLIIAAVLVPNALMSVWRSSLWSIERFKPVSLVGMTSSLLQLALVIVLYLRGWGGPAFAAAILGASLLQGIGLALIDGHVRRSTGIPFSMHLPRASTVRRYFAFVAPATLFLPLSIIVWERSEVFFLERFGTLEQVGYYNLSYSLFVMFNGLGGALMLGFYPAISRHYGAEDWQRIREQVQKGLLLATLYAVPLTFGGWATLDGLIGLLYGSRMQAAVPVASVLWAGLVPGTITSILGAMVTAAGGVWLNVRIGVVVSVVNVILNLVLIPRFGALGGAMANTSAQCTYAAILALSARRRFGVELPWRTMGTLCCIGALTTFLPAAVMRALFSGPWPLFGAITLSGLLYSLLVWGLGYLKALRPAKMAV